MTRSPKETFLQTPLRGEFEQMVATPAFQVACDYALLEFIQGQPQAKDPSNGWDSHSQLVGARAVLEILKSLYEPMKPQSAVKPPTLNYNT